MSIKPKYRVLGEANTSVQDPIEVTQKGEIVMTKSSATVAFVPTTIKNPKIATILPLMNLFVRQSASASVKNLPSAELNTALTPSSGLKLYTASQAYASGSFLTSAAVKNAYKGQVFIDATSKELYKMKALKAASNSASAATIGAVLASDSLSAVFVEKIPHMANVKFIKLSDVTAATTIAFNYEIKGYD